MWITCAWCGAAQGEKEPKADQSITHGICNACLTKVLGEDSEGTRKEGCDGGRENLR